MFNSIIFLVIIVFSLLIFAIPGTLKYLFTLTLIVAGALLTSVWSISVLTGAEQLKEIILLPPSFGSGMVLIVDKLTAFFLIVINITVIIGFFYAGTYLAPYKERMNQLRFSIHYFSWLWLWLSMLMVVMIRDGLFFLIVWEIMALSSFFLVIFDAEDRSILKTGINYLIQMHIGMFFILIAFLLVQKETGEISFDALKEYFAGHRNLPLFLLFFAGFAVKSGFIPLHTWLPEAHPAAPSHVSGIMSGVMLKMGIYGILRVLASMQSDLLTTGIIILIISLISGIFGIMMAIVQRNLKRLLAYSSIENIGIIGIGIGLGVIGQALGNSTLALLGFSGGLLHVLNHSLFKSLLFFSAGSVFSSAHTLNIEQLGGMMKKMPYTAMLFLTGSLAICGLPPFNGFISEYLIYMGMINGLSEASNFNPIFLIGSIAALSLIGGLAIFCFTKAFGITFLGQPRSEKAANAVEAGKKMIIPQLISAVLILIIGIGSALIVKPIFNITALTWNLGSHKMVTSAILSNLSQISIICGVFVISLMILLFYRKYHLSRRTVETGPVWGCGYQAVTHKQQYTATSFAFNYNSIARPILQTREKTELIAETEIFPQSKKFNFFSDDLIKKNIIEKPVKLVLELLKRIAMIQTGQIRHYVLYAFLFMLLVLLLAILNII